MRRRWKSVAVFAVVAVVLGFYLVLSWLSDHPEFDAIKPGMSAATIQAVLGPPRVEARSAALIFQEWGDGQYIQLIVWYGADGRASKVEKSRPYLSLRHHWWQAQARYRVWQEDRAVEELKKRKAASAAKPGEPKAPGTSP